MAGFMDKLKDTFGKAKVKIDDAMESEQVEKAKVKASELADKASTTAKETYEKVSDKAKGGDKPANISGPEALGDTDTPTAEAAAADDQA
ncbi:MAG: hypothetical protein CL424_01355 [Acidimicrobiaceae bacterium]|nr:hypothetical protein [Acidimicrobiaceae bacterium]